MNTDKNKREYSKKEEIDEFDEYETDEQEEFDDSDGQGLLVLYFMILFGEKDFFLLRWNRLKSVC